jgi:uroporphyrinogen-III synthase
LKLSTGPLAGHHVLITRPAGQGDVLLEGARALGAQATHIPLLVITPKADPELVHVAARLECYRAVLFVSANAVQASWPALTGQGAWPLSLPAAAIGPGTARVLRDHGVQKVIMPERCFDSEGLMALSFFSKSNVLGQSYALIRGEGGRDFMAQTLRQRGAVVDEVASYQRRLNPDALPALHQLFEQTPPTLIVISSSESLQRLMAVVSIDLSTALRKIPLVVPHSRIADAAQALGFEVVTVTEGGDQGILDYLKSYNETTKAIN